MPSTRCTRRDRIWQCARVASLRCTWCASHVIVVVVETLKYLLARGLAALAEARELHARGGIPSDAERLEWTEVL